MAVSGTDYSNFYYCITCYVSQAAQTHHMNYEKVTISDIAKAAGVSITTVSRYINGKQDLIQKDTRERIEAVIKMTNYHPNVMTQ